MKLGGKDEFGNMYLRKGIASDSNELWKYIPSAPANQAVLLKSLELGGGGKLKQAFRPTDLTYEAVLPKASALPLTINALPMDPASTVEIVQPAALKGIPSAAIAAITVTSADKKYAATYTIELEQKE